VIYTYSINRLNWQLESEKAKERLQNEASNMHIQQGLPYANGDNNGSIDTYDNTLYDDKVHEMSLNVELARIEGRDRASSNASFNGVVLRSPYITSNGGHAAQPSFDHDDRFKLNTHEVKIRE
jgi:hypothetical protein